MWAQEAGREEGEEGEGREREGICRVDASVWGEQTGRDVPWAISGDGGRQEQVVFCSNAP